jgi:hypothetical protein
MQDRDGSQERVGTSASAEGPEGQRAERCHDSGFARTVPSKAADARDYGFGREAGDGDRQRQATSFGSVATRHRSDTETEHPTRPASQQAEPHS